MEDISFVSHLVYFLWFSVPSTGCISSSRWMSSTLVLQTTIEPKHPVSSKGHLLKGLFWKCADLRVLEREGREETLKVLRKNESFSAKALGWVPRPAKSVGGAAFFQRSVGGATPELVEDRKQ